MPDRFQQNVFEGFSIFVQRKRASDYCCQRLLSLGGGQNLICALLSDPNLDIWAERPERLEQVLLARGPDAIGTVETDDVDVVNMLQLVGDPAAGRTAWLLTFPDEKSAVVIEGLGWPYDPEHVLLSRVEQYREAILQTEAFILKARRLAAFPEAAPRDTAG